MQTKISKTISIVFHPLLIPTYALLIIFNSGTYLSYVSLYEQKIIYIFVFINTLLIPLSAIPFLYSINIVKSLNMKSKKERIIPLAISAIAYFIAFFLLKSLSFSISKITLYFILFSGIIIIVTLFITIKWKISIHTIGIGGLIGLCISISKIYMVNINYILIILVFISGLVSYSRLQLKAHNSLQIYIGLFIGIAGILIPLLIML